ncbi:hypothetical protein [Actinacidiphila acididurans]|jgi:hypothetical protein|uniref:Uncharacterized protein n=1 Tax=Actinacidiphila acididurans TaxID=2784346 RepID=A0ABS2U7V5_9ACTN|nr:hypothetical protein [Actinacidiphila acididurans]MBM9510248.1 hypothetical protein [Actinacidiphila acididurans]
MGITVGKPDVTPDRPAHVAGVRRGNHQGGRKRQPGHRRNNLSTARRSTGINARHRNPVLPDMPNLSPA